MNQQWLTILKSKGIELEQNLRQQIQVAKDEVKTQLKDRGIRLSPADIAALIEEVSPKASHAALSYALDMVRPFSAGMGLRVSRLSDSHIEMILPVRARSLNESSHLHEAAFVTAAIEAAKILWMRHAPMGAFEINVIRIQADFLKQFGDECRARIELSESTRETILAEIRDRREAKSSVEVKFFDDNEQALAEIRLELNLKHTPALS
jgi:acyl-coenzyme A thioesterase PaaI-like protein